MPFTCWMKTGTLFLTNMSEAKMVGSSVLDDPLEVVTNSPETIEYIRFSAGTSGRLSPTI